MTIFGISVKGSWVNQMNSKITELTHLPDQSPIDWVGLLILRTTLSIRVVGLIGSW